MKRYLLFALALFLGWNVLNAAEKIQIGGIYYDLYSSTKTATVSSPSVSSPSSGRYSGNITIPSTVTYQSNTYSVKSIGSMAFYGCTGLTSITIPNSVTSIGEEAFDGCTGLTSVVWNAKKCGGWSSVSYSPFYSARGNITSFTFGNEVDSIPSYLCSGMSNLTSITIPTSVTSMGYSAFSNCTGLTSITIPNSVTSIKNYAFSGCTGLTSIVVESGNTVYDSRENCNAIIETATNTLIRGCNTTIIPNSVTSIENYAFEGCIGLTSITIPESVTSMGNSAFSGCTGLTSVVWNAKKCGWSSSYYDDAPFYNICKNITSFTFGNEVDSIPAYLCYSMSKLTAITIPNSVTSIGYKAFKGCTGFASVTIPESVTSIGDNAFWACTGLTSVVWNAKKCGGWSSSYYDYSPFYSVRNNITSFTFGNEVDSIPAHLCYSMSKLTAITIPNSVTSIGYRAFYQCTGLTSIRVNAQIPPQCRDNSFDNVPKDIPLYVPCGTKEAYQADIVWSSFTNIIDHDYSAIVQSSANGSVETISYTCGNELTIQATADEHYHFVRWSDGNTDNPRTLVVVQDTVLTAIFAPNQYTIYANAENGRVEGAGLYDYGSMAALYAYADEHYHFTHWSDGNTDNPRVVPVEEDAAYTAVFAIDQFTITATAEGNGYVSGDGTYDYGVEVILYAIADEHYHFEQWNDGNTDNPRTMILEYDASYVAIFAPNKYTISATATNGRIEGTGEYDYGTTATLTAIADEHYHFTQWSDGNTDNPRTITIEGDATYTAEFAIDQFTITATCDIQYGEVTGDGVYDYGTRITLTAIPNSGYEFKQWSNGLSYNPYRFTVVSDLTLEAEFIPATAIDNISADTDTTTPQKVLINGQVYILRNNKTYTLTGVEVK